LKGGEERKSFFLLKDSQIAGKKNVELAKMEMEQRDRKKGEKDLEGERKRDLVCVNFRDTGI
jgi:hypothetical protein